MAHFESIVGDTLIIEGGYGSNPNDSGNYTSKKKLVGTNKGISAIAYEQYIGREPTVQDMLAITTDIAVDVYKQLFWVKMIQGDVIKDQSVAWILFDCLVNSGQSYMSELKKSINAVVGNKLTVDDKNLTAAEIKIINSHKDQQELFEKIKLDRVMWYQSLIQKNPSKREFFLGWINRMNKISYSDAKGDFLGLSPKLLLRVGLLLLVLTAVGYLAYRYSR